MTEVWKAIDDYINYEVSNTGKVRSLNYLRSGRVQELKQKTRKSDGYKEVCLSKNGETRGFLVHRLVAAAFLANSDNLPVINHKDEHPNNNLVSNLEWSTVQHNTKWSAYKNTGINNCMSNPEIRKKQKEACQHAHDFESNTVYDMQTDTIYRSMHEAERQLGISRYIIKHTPDRFKIKMRGDDKPL